MKQNSGDYASIKSEAKRKEKLDKNDACTVVAVTLAKFYVRNRIKLR